MKYLMKKIFWVVGFVFLLLIACDDLNVMDENNPTIESYFDTAAELEEGVNAVYSTLRSAQIVGREWFFTHDMRGSEGAPGGPQLEAPRAELLTQATPSSSNGVMQDLWTGCYRMINRANLVISQAAGIEEDTDLRDRIVGEAKFLRAWAYFELVSQWGDVPVYTQPIESSVDFVGTSPADEIYSLIETDLIDAISRLPEAHNSSNNGRVTQGAANTLLGKAYMQSGNYEAARDALLRVYGKYSLVDEFSWNFDGDVLDDSGVLIETGHEFNAESIFEVAFVDKGDGDFNWGYDGEGTTSAMSTVRNQEYGITWGNVIPSDRILNEFEDGDPRYKFTIWEEGDTILKESPAGPHVLTSDDMNIATSTRNGVEMKRFYRKYNIYDWVSSANHPGGLNQRMYRYADVLLMLAECEAEIGVPSKAADYINEVRSRPSVNMPDVVLNSKQEAIKAVMHERAVELAMEEVNNIDMLRWRKQGYYPSIMPDPKPDQVDMLPIPASERSTNPAL